MAVASGVTNGASSLLTVLLLAMPSAHAQDSPYPPYPVYPNVPPPQPPAPPRSPRFPLFPKPPPPPRPPPPPWPPYPPNPPGQPPRAPWPPHSPHPPQHPPLPASPPPPPAAPPVPPAVPARAFAYPPHPLNAPGYPPAPFAPQGEYATERYKPADAGIALTFILIACGVLGAAGWLGCFAGPVDKASGRSSFREGLDGYFGLAGEDEDEDGAGDISSSNPRDGGEEGRGRRVPRDWLGASTRRRGDGEVGARVGSAWAELRGIFDSVVDSAAGVLAAMSDAVRAGDADVFTGGERMGARTRTVPEGDEAEPEGAEEGVVGEVRGRSAHHLRGAASLGGVKGWMSRRVVDPNAAYEPLNVGDEPMWRPGSDDDRNSSPYEYSYRFPEEVIHEDDVLAESDGSSGGYRNVGRGGGRGGVVGGTGMRFYGMQRPSQSPQPTPSGLASSEWRDNLLDNL